MVVAAGFALALALAFLAFVRINVGGTGPLLAYRQSEEFQADTVLLVTQAGFPWGRTVLPSAPPATGTPAPESSRTLPYADATRFASLAVFYAQIANSDPVQTVIQKGFTPQEKLTDKVQASASLPDPSVYNGVLPFIDIQGLSTSASRAISLSLRGASVFQNYIKQQQTLARIPSNDRVLLEIVKRPGKTNVTVVVPRKKTLPIVVFLTVMVATIGAVLVLENLRQGRHADDSDAEAPAARQVA